MVIEQGRAYNASAQGYGIAILAFGAILMYFSGSNYFSWLPFLVGVGLAFIGGWVLLARRRVDFTDVDKGVVRMIVRVGRLKMVRNIKVNDYNAAVIKRSAVVYRVNHMVHPGIIINQTDSLEEFNGLFLYRKGRFEEELLVKANRRQLVELIEKVLMPITDWRFFEAAIRTDTEILPKT